MFELLIIAAIVAAIASGGKKKTKTTETYRQGGDEITEVTFHDTGKKVTYRNGRRVS